MLLGPGMTARAKTTGETLQVILIQGLVGYGQTAPPEAESTALLTEREVAVQHDRLDTIIPPVEELFVAAARAANLVHRWWALAPSLLSIPSLGVKYQHDSRLC